MEIRNKGKRCWMRIAIAIAGVFILVSLASCDSAESKQANEKVTKLEKDLDQKSKKVKELESDLKERDNSIEEMEAKLEEAKPWFEMSEKEKEREMAEEKKKEEKEKAAEKKKAKKEKEAKLAAEEKERKKQEEEEKKGYDTGITFDQLARNPDDYEGEKVKFSGKVLQVMEGDEDNIQLRVAVDSDYDKVIYVEYDSSIVDSRVLENDTITLMGISAGLLSYESTMGGTITIPAIIVDKIE